MPEPVKEVFVRFFHWIDEVMKIVNAKSVCLWCQGMDFDAAILRNICRKYDLQLTFPYQQFRDCRTIILEAAFVEAERSLNGHDNMANGIVLPGQVLAGNRDAYKIFDPLPEKYTRGSDAHDALYDAVRSSWNTWQALKWLHQS
jgi:hypothetical protein